MNTWFVGDCGYESAAVSGPFDAISMPRNLTADEQSDIDWYERFAARLQELATAARRHDLRAGGAGIEWKPDSFGMELGELAHYARMSIKDIESRPYREEDHERALNTGGF